MIIEKNAPYLITFDSLERGEVFEVEGDVFMKIRYVSTESGDAYNVVNLASGELEWYEPTCQVVPRFKAKLVIEG